MRYRALAVVTAVACACALFPWNVAAFVTGGRWSIPAVVFFFNPQNHDVSADAAEAALLTGMHAWHDQGGADFEFIYGGRTSNASVVFNNRNELFFRDAVSDTGPGTIATTYTWSSNGTIVEADIVFWDGAFTFVAGNAPCSSAQFIEDVATHEFGHALGLGHSSVPGATMAPSVPACSQELRSLSSDDIAGLQALYGVANGANTPPSVSILKPSEGDVYDSVTRIGFQVSVSDAQDTFPQLWWYSSIDGYLGSLNNFNRTLSVGTHVITAIAVDSGGLSTSRSVTITVTEQGTLPAGTNVARDTAGATATSSGSLGEYLPGLAINGDRTGFAFWHDRTLNSYPDFVRVDFATTYTIGQVNVVGVQDTWPNSGDPAADTTALAYGLRDFEVQYLSGNDWITVPGASVTNNTLALRSFVFTPIATRAIRVMITRAADGYSRIAEIEALTPGAEPPPPPSPPPPPPPPPPTTTGTNVASASAGAVATASSTYSTDFAVTGVNNGDRSGALFGGGTGGWHDTTFNTFPDWVQIDFAAPYTIGHVNVFSVQDAYASPSEPTTSQTFTRYGLTEFAIQYWDGASWVAIPGAAVTGNSLVWRGFSFGPVTTQKIRVLITGTADGYSRVAEIEAFTSDEGPAPPPPTPPANGTNVALASAGAVATVSSFYSTDFSAAGINNGDRRGAGFGRGDGGWNDATFGLYPDWAQIDFASEYTIGQVNVFSVQDNYSNPTEPTGTEMFSYYGLTDFVVQYWNGSDWVSIPGATVSGNSLVWRAITFTPVTTQKIRLLITGTADGFSRLVELEAITAP